MTGEYVPGAPFPTGDPNPDFPADTGPRPRPDQGADFREGAEERVCGGWAERSGAHPEQALSGDSLAEIGRAPEEGLEQELRVLANKHRRKPRRRVKVEDVSRAHYTPKQRLLLLDTWLRSKLPAKDYSAMVGVSIQTLYKWKRAFLREGPAGLADQPRRKLGSRLTEEVKRAILMLKEAHPDWGQDRIAMVLARIEAYGVSAEAVGRFLEESGYQVLDVPTKPHPDKVRRFERAKPNQLWQTDLFTFTLKRENRRVHLVAFMDDHSRYIVGFGLHSTASGALVREVFESGIINYGPPEEVLTDNGTQYHTWRGKSAFRKLCERRGIKQVVASPRHPQTLGKVERFWGTLWRELLQEAIFRGIEDARKRIGHFIDYYNFHRPHQGIEGLVPADRYFGAAEEVKATLKARIHDQALELAKNGEPRKPVYLSGRVGDRMISLHAEGDKVYLTEDGKDREEVNLHATGRRQDTLEPLPEAEECHPEPLAQDGAPPDPEGCADDSNPLPPGVSPLDLHLTSLMAGLQPTGEPETNPQQETQEEHRKPQEGISEASDGNIYGDEEVAP